MEGALGAITGLIGAGLSASNQAVANQINYMNLLFQKRQAEKNFRLSTAGRTDAYGNKQKYDDIMNEWILSLTPMQQQITKAGEKEQLLSLTEDAKRRRDINRATAARGKDAANDYARVLADWRYGGPRSELSIRDELTNLLAGSANEKAGQDKAELMRAALREGRGGDIPGIIKALNDSAGSNMADVLLKAHGQAREEYSARVAQHNQTDMPILQQLEALMEAGGSAPPPNMPNISQQLAAMQQDQFKGIQSAITTGASGVGNAYKALAASSGKSPDFSGIAKGLNAGSKYANKNSQAPYYSMMDPPDGYDDTDLSYDRFNPSYGGF